LIVKADRVEGDAISDLLSAQQLGVIRCEGPENGELALNRLAPQLSVMIVGGGITGGREALGFAVRAKSTLASSENTSKRSESRWPSDQRKPFPDFASARNSFAIRCRR
jgi:hypothetical protein